jgi:hypothetical protein
MTARALTARVRDLGAAVGLVGLSAHDLRHYWATRAARSGTPLDRLQDAGGWAVDLHLKQSPGDHGHGDPHLADARHLHGQRQRHQLVPERHGFAAGDLCSLMGTGACSCRWCCASEPARPAGSRPATLIYAVRGVYSSHPLQDVAEAPVPACNAARSLLADGQRA